MTPGGPPDAWTAWRRHGVAQFHQPHNLFPRFRQILDREMPEMVERLVAAGCVWVDMLAPLPPSIEDRALTAGTPHVCGVRTALGEQVRADLVVDAMGRRTPTADWLTGLGARTPEMQTEGSGFMLGAAHHGRGGRSR